MGFPLPGVASPTRPVAASPQPETRTGPRRAPRTGLVAKRLSSVWVQQLSVPRRRRSTPDPDPNGSGASAERTPVRGVDGTDGRFGRFASNRHLWVYLTALTKATVERRYKDRDGSWKSTGSFSRNEIPLVIYCLTKAFDTMVGESSGDGVESPPVREESVR